MINEYFVYILLAVTIVTIPGPAVILTIKNSIQYGIKISVAGILGNFIAMVIMATISAFGLGAIILASSAFFSTVKIVGCIYLMYLGVKIWMSPLSPQNKNILPLHQNNKKMFTVFREGFGSV